MTSNRQRSLRIFTATPAARTQDEMTLFYPTQLASPTRERDIYIYIYIKRQDQPRCAQRVDRTEREDNHNTVCLVLQFSREGDLRRGSGDKDRCRFSA
jgi:hypothetical protein